MTKLFRFPSLWFAPTRFWHFAFANVACILANSYESQRKQAKSVQRVQVPPPAPNPLRITRTPQSAGRSLAFLPSFARLASFHLFIRGAFFSISSNSSLASSGVRTTLGRSNTNSLTSRVDLSFFLKAHPNPGMLPIIGV